MQEVGKERSLAVYLVAFAAVIVVPLMLLAVAVAWRFADAEISRLKLVGQQRTEDVAAEIERMLGSRLDILRVLATSPAIDASDHAAFDAQARQFTESGVDIRLRALDGRLLVDTGLPPGEVLPHWPLLEPMTEAIRSRQPVFSSLFVSRGTSTYAVAIFVPVVRDGTVVALVSNTFSPEVFHRFMVRAGISDPYFASLSDRSGLIIARSANHEASVARQLPSFDAAVGRSGSWNGINADGLKVRAFYQRSDLSGWLVTLGLRESAIDAALWRTFGGVTVVGLLLVILSIAMATVLVRRLSRAANAMVEAAAAMERGQLTVVPRTDIVEVNRVGEAFGRASVKLHLQASALARANRELERRVEERGAALEASEERYRLLAENARDTILLRNVEGRLFYASPSCQRLLGYTPEEIVAIHPVSIVHPDDWRRVDGVNRAMADGRELGFSIHRLRHKEGHWVWIQAAYSRLPHASSDEPSIMVVVRDDTERQEQETKLRQTNESLRQFSAIVSHDLQAPLRHINMFSDMLGARVAGTDAEAAGYAAKIQGSVERMQRLIRSLNAYTQVAYALEKRDAVDLAVVVSEAVAMLDADIQAAGATIKVFNLPTIEGDQELLVRLFQNLIGNAVKYRGDEPPVVKIRARPAGRFWEVAVEDNGIGIDPLYADRVFEIFRRLHRDESRYPGIGLGLALCRRIVESHGGEIWLDKDWPKGARFQMTLPRRRAKAERRTGGGDGETQPVDAVGR
ncbi:sensor histidine kinase [Phreatobacter oligotrophus]|uniref:histidine kinase n=1 Tax=Phreatobacter oligotrophus TaxID=1122261 RepID=A0A2T4ZFW3_9HYPH|nr:ATP-binding protein [Phreatobacter oligotrophus]PTM60810.1 PAS domain S-box-containing protein [Phreatobacter oligotrophus]